MSGKVKFQCILCQKILNEPVSLPCLCTSICKQHVADIIKKDNNSTIQCQECKKEFEIPTGFKENKQIRDIINMDIYLTPEEKALKTEMKNKLCYINELVDELNLKANEFSSNQFDYFSNLKRLIDLRRESLILKIHTISDELIKKVEQANDIFKKAANKISSHNITFDYSQEANNLNEIFRNCNIQMDTLNKLKKDNTKQIAEIISKLSNFKFLEENLEKNKFQPDSFVFTSDLFGSLNIFTGVQNLNLNICTYFLTEKPKYIMQHFYHCHTCKMFDGIGVCEICAKICHRNHDVSYAKYGLFFCDCGAKKNKSCMAMAT
jgi:hypothetical protein